ncbi:hypothetical protein [Chromobacterium vaccinii]|nr:hypothetical protein [Chromobacterium vaccinii]
MLILTGTTVKDAISAERDEIMSILTSWECLHSDPAAPPKQ